MPIDLSPEDQPKPKAFDGSVASPEALDAGLEAIHEEEEWQDYARDRIAAGLEDIEMGRTTSGDDFLTWLQTQRTSAAR